MIPAKNRERKCSTCKHYQSSPLWRKGWCRNPLLYDRNTNHLVEADSLACNRTFIDYWEPVDGPGQTAVSSRSRNVDQEGSKRKPRIAPSVPLDTVDKQGNRLVANGNTPVAGLSSVPPKQVLTLTPTHKPSPFTVLTHSELDEEDEQTSTQDESRATLQMDRTTGPTDAEPEEEHRPTAVQRAAQPPPQKPVTRRTGTAPIPIWARPLPFVRLPLWTALLVLILLAAGGGGWLLTRNVKPKPGGNGGVLPVPSLTVAQATPTGFGDPTVTAPPKPTLPPTTAPVAPPPNVLAIGNYAQVTGSRTGLSVRSDPTTKGKKLVVVSDGAKLHIVGGPQTADGFTWWKVQGFDPNDPAATGWCVDKFLTPAPPQ